MIIAPLTTIKLQLEADCHKLGFSVLVGDQVLRDVFGNVHHLRCSPATVSANFCFSAPARRFGEAASEASLGAHRLRRVLGVN